MVAKLTKIAKALEMLSSRASWSSRAFVVVFVIMNAA
jgi:hypothetical protein